MTDNFQRLELILELFMAPGSFAERGIKELQARAGFVTWLGHIHSVASALTQDPGLLNDKDGSTLEHS